jgi:hypothetical protein
LGTLEQGKWHLLFVGTEIRFIWQAILRVSMARDNYVLQAKKKETGMKIKIHLNKWIIRAIFLMATAIFTFTGCTMLEPKNEPAIHAPEPPKVRVQENQLQPGLSVLYFHAFYRHIDEMPKGRMAIARGIPGQPIPVLNHKFAKEEIVFQSGKFHGVGMHLDGFILFEKPGEYVFQANSNDGFRLFINDLRIINDPNVHSDRLSEKGIVKISEAGWYPLRILYFQRKGTAAIQLFWEKPGDKKMVIVPPEAYAHIPIER